MEKTKKNTLAKVTRARPRWIGLRLSKNETGSKVTVAQSLAMLRPAGARSGHSVQIQFCPLAPFPTELFGDPTAMLTDLVMAARALLGSCWLLLECLPGETP